MSAYSDLIRSLSPEGYWRLGETTGATAYDSSGNGENGTYYGSPTLGETALINRDANASVSFDGTDDYVDTGILDIGDGSAATILCWVKPSSTPSSSSARGPLYGDSIAIIWDHPTAGYRGAAQVQLGASSWYGASFGTFQSNKTYLLAAVFDGSTLKAYKNGVLQTTTPASGSLYTAVTTMKIASDVGATTFWPGVVDEAAVFSAALSEDDIRRIFAAGLAGYLDYPKYVHEELGAFNRWPMQVATTIGDGISGYADGQPIDSKHWLIQEVDTQGLTSAHYFNDRVRMVNDYTTGATRIVVCASRAKLSGDFDVEVGFHNFAVSHNSLARAWLAIPATWIAVSTDDSGNPLFEGGIAGVSSAARTNDYGKLRFVRVGSTATVYYKDGDAASWTQLRTGTTTTDDVAINLQLWCDGAADATSVVEWGDFIVNSGAVVKDTAARDAIGSDDMELFGAPVTASDYVLLDGVDDYMSTPIQSQHTNEDRILVFCRARIPSGSSGGTLFALLPKGAYANSTGADLQVLANGNLRARVGAYGSYTEADDTSADYRDDLLHTFVMAGDTASARFYIYVDGVQTAERSLDYIDFDESGGVAPDPATFYIGAARTNASSADLDAADTGFLEAEIHDAWFAYFLLDGDAGEMLSVHTLAEQGSYVYSSDYAGEVIDLSPKAYWRLNELPGDTPALDYDFSDRHYLDAYRWGSYTQNNAFSDVLDGKLRMFVVADNALLNRASVYSNDMLSGDFSLDVIFSEFLYATSSVVTNAAVYLQLVSFDAEGNTVHNLYAYRTNGGGTTGFGGSINSVSGGSATYSGGAGGLRITRGGGNLTTATSDAGGGFSTLQTVADTVASSQLKFELRLYCNTLCLAGTVAQALISTVTLNSGTPLLGVRDIAPHLDSKPAKLGYTVGAIGAGAPGLLSEDPDGGYALDSSSNYLAFPDSSGFTHAAFTWVIWVDLDDNAAGQSVVVAYPQGAHSDARGAVLIVTPAGEVSFQYGTTSGGSWETSVVSSSAGILGGGKKMLAVTFGGDGQPIKLYVNGSENGSGTASGDIEWADAGSGSNRFFAVGAYSNSSNVIGTFLEGTVDEFAIFDTVLSAADISTLYDAGTASPGVLPEEVSTAVLVVSQDGSVAQSFAEEVSTATAVGETVSAYAATLEAIAVAATATELPDTPAVALIDSVLATGTQLSSVQYSDLIVTLAAAATTVDTEVGVGITDTVHVSELFDYTEAVGIIERINASAGIEAPFTSYEELVEAIQVGAGYKITAMVVGADGIVLSDAAAVTRTLELVDAIASEDTYAASLLAIVQVSQAIAVETLYEANSVVNIYDVIALADSVTRTMLAAMLAAETVIVSDHTPGALFFYTTTAEAVLVSDTPVGVGTLVSLIEEGVDVSFSLRLGNDTYAAWLVNPRTGAASRYDNYPFTSVAAYRGRYYATAEDGVYRLEGDDDAGATIQASLKTGLLHMGSKMAKRMGDVFIGVESSGRLVLKVTTEEAGRRTENWYEVVSHGDTSNHRAKLGRGARGVYWGFELVNAEGGDFDLDSLQLHPLILSRKV